MAEETGSLPLETIVAKETRETVTSWRKTSRLFYIGVKRIAVRTKRQSSRGRGDAPTVALKGNRSHRQRRVASGESLLDLCRKVYFLHRRTHFSFIIIILRFCFFCFHRNNQLYFIWAYISYLAIQILICYTIIILIWENQTK
mgnify:CR=1 FL=1